VRAIKMTDVQTQEKPSSAKLVLAFAAVYLVWGSTYLGIRYAIETIPPFLFAGTRFLVAGAVLYLWARVRGAARPDPINWRAALIAGGLLLFGGNGFVVMAEQSVPSGLTALLVATEPLMIVLLNWARPGGSRPSARVALGLALGLVGMFLLVGPANLAGKGEVSLLGAGLLMVATTSWAAGSLYAVKAKVASSPLLAAGMQMLAGGALLLVVGLARGETSGFAIGDVSLRSAVAHLYLIIFGSIIGFTCYSWLLRVTPPSLASTYAYVNPVVAVILGWAIAGEPLTLRTMMASAVILAAVVIITSHKEPDAAPAEMKGSKKEANRFAEKMARRECMGAGD
jgi:drug/metabolite transporter (DMT)-like permease